MAAHGVPYVAVYGCDGDTEDELSFKAGDIIMVVDSSDANWWTGAVDGTGPTGTFPANYVASVEDEGGGGGDLVGGDAEPV